MPSVPMTVSMPSGSFARISPHWAAETYGRIGGCPSLDGGFQKITKYLGHTVFGQVYKGMDVVNAIAECDTDFSDRPLDEQVMESVTVETFGLDYPEPEKV